LPAGYKATTKLRCRVPLGKKISSVTLNGARWTDFSSEQELVTIPPGHGGTVRLEISY
jgi:hypothetical protein